MARVLPAPSSKARDACVSRRSRLFTATRGLAGGPGGHPVGQHAHQPVFSPVVPSRKGPSTLNSERLSGISSLFKGCQMPTHGCHIRVLTTCPKNPWSKRSGIDLGREPIMVRVTALNFVQHFTVCQACLRQEAESVLSRTGTL